MKKEKNFILIFACACLLSAHLVQGALDFKQEIQERESLALLTNKQAIIGKLYTLLQIISDDTQNHDRREKATIDFTQTL